ncbi:type VII secretion protein EsaA [Enterococcus sp. AZ109]|uniref:type VII secretion protein EsaA n=1 Tax=Enterococcus sp. AZ109 TaxID=2774634 RepID=UPI003F2602F2
MKIQNRNKLSLLAIALGGALVAILLLYFGLKDENLRKVTEDQNSKVTYVLVNEDIGATFENKQYVLGRDFVTLINQDSENNWQTTTRSVADAGIDSGQFDAVIYIPQNFSERLLNLQSVEPDQATINYRVSEGQNEITNQTIQLKVNDILKDFNQRIVQMYFSSIVGNLAEAQRNVNTIVQGDKATHTTLETNVQVPFKELPTGFSSVLDVSSILNEDNERFLVEQKSFVESVNQLMQSNIDSINNTSESTEDMKTTVDDFTEEVNKKIETAVQQFNAQVELQKEQLTTQWDQDLKNYRGQFDGLNFTANQQMSHFYQRDPLTNQESGVYVDFYSQAAHFQNTQNERLVELKNEIQQLEQQVVTLEELRKKIASVYYADSEKTPESATEDDAKLAILKLMEEPTANGSNLVETYFKHLAFDLGTINPTELRVMLQCLVDKGVLSESEKNRYFILLDIIERYSNDYNVSIGTSPAFSFIGANTPHPEFITIPQQITFSLNPTNGGTLQLSSSEDVVIDDLAHLAQQIKARLDPAVSGSNYISEVSVVSPSSLQIEFIPDPNSNPGSVNPTTVPPSNPLPNEVTFSVGTKVKWTLKEVERSEQFVESQFEWQLGGQKISGYHASFIDQNKPLIGDLPAIFSQFEAVGKISQQIITLFADPNAPMDATSFYNWMNASENRGRTLGDAAGEKSIYMAYDNISNEEKKKIIQDSLAKEYKKCGDGLYKQTVDQISALKTTIGTAENAANESNTLYNTLYFMSQPKLFLDEADKLNKWFVNANEQISTTYDTWKESEQVAAQSVINEENPHPELGDTKPVAEETASIVKGMKELIESTREAADVTEKSAAEVQDVGPQIEELTKTTKDVQSNADTVLNNLESVVTEVRGSDVANDDYRKNFEQVLANTRQGGADNQKVFNFLASPMSIQGEFGEKRTISVIPYYMTLIGTIVAIALGYGVASSLFERKVRQQDFFVTKTRIWKNTPKALHTLAVSSLMAILVSGITTNLLPNIASIPWFMYTLLVFLSYNLFATALARQFKRGAIYLWGLLFGFYLMMTPLLGMTTTPGSIVNIIFRFSPLQNIENGYTALLNGYSIGWFTYLFLGVLSLVAFGTNFIVDDQKKKAEDSQQVNAYE